MNKIKALIDAGKKATQGEFYSSSHRPDQANIKVLNGSLSVKEHPTLCVFAANLIQPSDEKHSTAEFFVQALNTRAEIKALYEQYEALQGTIESQKQTFDALMKKYRKLEEAAEKMVAALRGCREELWDEWHSSMSEDQFNSDPTIDNIDQALTQYNTLKTKKD